jgi:hypothetical protein
LLLLWAILLSAGAWAGTTGPAPHQADQAEDACRRLLGYPSTQLGQILEAHLRRRFPATAQLAEGNARLSELSLRTLDCQRQQVIVAGRYEFRGNIGVIDLTRRGTAVLQLHLTPQAQQRQVRLENPAVLDVTFDNPAPWFDGKAIADWALALFATPLCANLQNGQPC